MLSILIPIYNTPVTKLVDELIYQCKKAKINFEIICLDDGSKPSIRSTNEKINGLFGVNYVELSENIGRSKIRNRMSKLARYDRLLFLDSDSKLPNKKFIKSYVEHLNDNQVIVGGTCYAKSTPKTSTKILHWKYGHRREAIRAKKRNKHPYWHLHSNNFILSREVALSFPFDDTISGYGYEDIELGQRLEEAKIPILHIDNPVLHRGIKKVDQFLSDQVNAIENLAQLYFAGKVKSTRLIQFYEHLKDWGLLGVVVSFIEKREQNITDSLKSKSNSLYRLDLLKLYYFDRAFSEIKKGGQEA